MLSFSIAQMAHHLKYELYCSRFGRRLFLQSIFIRFDHREYKANNNIFKK